MTPLRWLDFEQGEVSDDAGVFDAMASVALCHAAQVEAEIAQVLAWAEATFPGQRGPVEEGGAWDADLQVVQEHDGIDRTTFSFTVVGSAAFCEAFAARFGAAIL